MAAGGDPLHAQQMENELSQIWFERWLVDHQARGIAASTSDE